MKAYVQRKLASYAKRVLQREKPEVIGITGSVGKSSAKQAVAAVLERKFHVRPSPKNYNTEFGVPLTVLDLPAAKGSLGWLGVLKRAWKQAAFGQAGPYPKVLVLEMAADRPGDIAVLCDIAPPRIGVVTAVGESHAEFFGSVDAIVKEKRTLVERLPKDGIAILNRDDDKVWAMRERTKAAVRSFGLHEEADVRALPDSVTFARESETECGMHFKIAADGATIPVVLPDVLGRHAIYAGLAAAAVGLAKGMNLVEIADRLRAYQPPPGRMRCLAGIKRSIIIDDTYNAATKSAVAALDTLADLPVTGDDRRIAVLGDMLELGALSKEGHETVGKRAAASGSDLVVFVGERMGDAEKAALDAGASKDRVFHFSTPEQAGRFVQERMMRGDVILVKGSRGMKMEKVVKELMADPMAAERLLVSVDESSKW
jgi:UDP-N-acetylmuramoyl-tripeptide--D-alanyl-D-alanine ligase